MITTLNHVVRFGDNVGDSFNPNGDTNMSNLIPVFNSNIQNEQVQLIDARILHSFLEVTSRFNDWITNRIKEYEFIEN